MMRTSTKSDRMERVRRGAWASRSILRVLRANCFECMGEAANEIPKCTSTTCLWFPFRCAESIRQGFNAAADALEAEGHAGLAAKSRDLLAASRQAWTERKTSDSEPESGEFSEADAEAVDALAAGLDE